MNWFPQIQSGSVAQFPLARSRAWRSIANLLENGERIALPDAPAGSIEWVLTYAELTDGEAANITALFNTVRGRLTPFAFADPMANLLGWSETLTNQCWQPGLLQISGAASDPLGTQLASTIHNTSGGLQGLSQSVNVPGSYVACFSVYVRSTNRADVTISRDGQQAFFPVGPSWSRVFVSGTGANGAQQSTFTLSVNPGQSVDVWGLQVETQPYASKYKPTKAARGIYEETYFASDQLAITNTGPGLSRCQVSLISRA